MQHFKWTKAHAIFLPQVDAEHRNLFRMAEELQQAVHAGAKPDRILELMRPFIAAVEEHFTYEERLMRASVCPDFEWHKLQHDTARKRARKTVKELEAGSAEKAPEFVEHLGKWFRDHMGLTDRMMGAHVRNYDRLHAAIAS